jgi:hypothetical protein
LEAGDGGMGQHVHEMLKLSGTAREQHIWMHWFDS